MNKHEFAVETEDMFRGTGRLADLTPQRLTAMWEQYGHLSLPVWKNTKARVLLEPRWPSAERFDALVGICENNEERRVANERNREAAAVTGGGGIRGIMAGVHADGNDPYIVACKQFQNAIFTQEITPSAGADLLEMHCTSPGIIGDMRIERWIAALREAGDDWSKLPRGGNLAERVRTAAQAELGW